MSSQIAKLRHLEVRDLHHEVELPSSPLAWLTGKKNSANGSRWRTILDGVNLNLYSGEVMAVMGSSGSGKTSLLDVIACRHDSACRTTGGVFFDGVPRTESSVRSLAAYVRQDDRLVAQLTVRETLRFVAALKLPASMPSAEKAAQVEAVIHELGLWHVAEHRVGSVDERGVSGGERRRVSIGVQMLLDPQLLLLDEPTSGLDAFTASQLVNLLRELANRGRLVLLSVHQPRATIFKQFDKLLLLSAGGRTVYCGSSGTPMLRYFERAGFCCPRLSNPADYVLDVATIDMHSEQREETSRARVDQLVKQFADVVAEREGKMWNEQEDSAIELSSDDQDDGEQSNRLDVRVKMGRPALRSVPTGRPVGMLGQFAVLFQRALRAEVRAVSWQVQQIITALLMSATIGLIFFDLGKDQRSVRDRLSLLYIVVALYPFIIVLDTVAKLHSERRIFYYEIQDGMYSTTPFFVSKLLSEIPFHVLGWLAYASTFYWMSGLKRDLDSFLQNAVFSLLVLYASRSVALAVASSVHHFQV